jgi:hypothetical protein
MNAQETAEFLNNDVVWEPRLTVHASLPRHGTGYSFGYADPVPAGGSEVHVLLTLQSVDSSAVRPDGSYPEGPRVPVQRMFTLYEHELTTRERVLYRVIREITVLHEHETREYTRLRSNLSAPFHPHRPDGTSLWSHDGRAYQEKLLTFRFTDPLLLGLDPLKAVLDMEKAPE